MIASTATILARIRPPLPSSPSASTPSKMSMPSLSMRLCRVFWSPVASNTHSAAWSRARRPSWPGGGRFSEPRMATRGTGDCCSSNVATCTLAARSAAKPARPLALRIASSEARKGSSTLRPTAARSTSAPLGRSESANSVKTAASSACSGLVQLVPRADSRHFSSAAVGMRTLPSLPSRRRVSHMVASAVMPARGTSSSPSSVKTRASWMASSASASSGSCVKPQMSAKCRAALACALQSCRSCGSRMPPRSRLRASSTAGSTGRGPAVLQSCRATASSSSSPTSCPEAMAKSTASAASRTSTGASSACAFSRRRSRAPALSSEPVALLCMQRPLSFVQASTISSGVLALEASPWPRSTSSRCAGRASSRLLSPDLRSSSRSRLAASTASRFWGSALTTLA
mmetsp:Transcript_66761/g.215152  ORF Transcript_66761/g.215152 Transcript_66761/m.215152 type:complete len:402 (-) Transcript_66761:288-1493(-)